MSKDVHTRSTTLACLISAIWLILPGISAEAAGTGSGNVNRIDPVTGMEFVDIPGGCFRMGSESGNNDEKPVHDVCVSPFYMGKYEVTQGEWRKVMGDNPSRFSQCGDDCPVERVSSTDAIAFARRLSSMANRNYRLPTEAEWEYACTGGKREEFCGGNDPDAVAWIAQNSNGTTHPVGKKRPNSLGIHDMSGNVWEWVMDFKAEYPSSSQNDPGGPEAGATRVRRGGSWQYGPRQSRPYWRSSGYPDDLAIDIGFRLVLTADPSEQAPSPPL